MELQWPLILFTTFIAWSAGLFGAQGAMALVKGPDGKRGVARKAQMPALIVSVVLLAIGGIAVFFHLQHWERIFNGFGHITSGITQELIAIVVFFIVIVAYFIMLRRAEVEGTVPVWCAVIAIVISLVLAAICAHSYMMESRPTWNSVLQLLSVVGAAVLLGPATLAVIMTLCKDDMKPIGTPMIVGAVIGAVCTIAYAVYLQFSGDLYVDVPYYFDGTNPTKGMTDPSSVIASLVLIIWGGAVVVGGVIPVIASILAKKLDKPLAWKILSIVVVACGIAGAIFLRMAFYELGFTVFMLY